MLKDLSATVAVAVAVGAALALAVVCAVVPLLAGTGVACAFF